MADINIQRKKSAPSPWLLVLLAALAVAVGAYFFLRPGPADEPAPAATPIVPADTAARAPVPAPPVPDTARPPAAKVPGTGRTAHTPPAGDDADAAASLATQAATDPKAPDYARQGLLKLTGVLVALADRDDLRDPTIAEQRDNLTSATSRLGETGTSPRPGFVAAAALMRAMQQKAYPDLDGPTADLTRLAGQLSGRSATAAEQRQNQDFFTQAAAVVRVLSEPTP